MSNHFHNKVIFDSFWVFIQGFKSVENINKKLIEFELGLQDIMCGMPAADRMSLKLIDLKKY